ncbi:hypothetical protein DSL72_003006 [Monilinia vaccinii-corymbosi]|uniref:Uncharacterized protein n=1 Tax=Monilinia vaccinii-corymbosi TaxID=61207 RepID=A0A8A3P7D9_9HELO|nr:hypothetical protein DSL72_003006 [Monilinia vaccinii-corymbosi]
MPVVLSEDFSNDDGQLDKDIITVHGLCGSTKEPWLDEDSRPKWIEKDFFKNSGARVIVFSYPSGPDEIDIYNHMGVGALAVQLLDELKQWSVTLMPLKSS